MTNLAAGRSPSLAIRMAEARRVLMRGLAANLAGKAWRQVGQVFLPCPTHRLKQERQKLCWQGACMCAHSVSAIAAQMPRQRRTSSA